MYKDLDNYNRIWYVLYNVIKMSVLNVFISKDQKQVTIGAFEVLFGVVKYLFLD